MFNSSSIFRGSEFKNGLIKKFLSKAKVKLIFSNSSFKASHIERAQYTLERLIFSHITAKESLAYIHVLQNLVDRYNSTIHSFTHFTPYEVENDLKKQDEVMIRFGRKYQKLKKVTPKFALNDKVRILLFKGPFHRGYNLQRSYEVFKIARIIDHKIPLYVLEDEKNREIAGVFNEFELVLVDIDRFRVNVIQRKKIRGKEWVKLRWKGYPKEFDSWQEEEASDLVNL